MIPLCEPNLSGKEKEYLSQAISTGWVSGNGPFVERFEEMVAKASGRRWAVATTTGTAALHVSAFVSDFQEMRTVVTVPDLAYPAARNVLWNLGCAIIVEEDTGKNHDRQDYLGFSDRAPAIGEPRTEARIECYSFAGNKTVTCGQGGAVVGDEWALETDIRRLINNRTGIFNFRLSNICAAVGCAQMERLEEFREKKRSIWNRYHETGLPMIDRGASRWMSTMEWNVPLVTEEFEFRRERTWGISLPCSTTLTRDQQDKVIKCVESLR